MVNEAKRPLKQMAGRAGARVDEGGEAPMRLPRCSRQAARRRASFYARFLEAVGGAFAFAALRRVANRFAWAAC
jgi:hypothetical protein